jgi:hypothetical protein
MALQVELLQKAIDEMCSNLQSWDAVIPFPVILPVMPGMLPTTSLCDNILSTQNLNTRVRKFIFAIASTQLLMVARH